MLYCEYSMKWITLIFSIGISIAQLQKCPQGGISCDIDPSIDPTLICEGHNGICCVYSTPVAHSAKCECKSGWAGNRCHIAVNDGDWFVRGQIELNRALYQTAYNTGVAKNIILFIGDGMGMSTITSARIYHGQNQGKSGEETAFVFETFPFTGISKTYCVDQQVPDSAATATAMLTGHKVNCGTLGVSRDVINSDYKAVKNNKLESIIKWAQDAGKRTGIVTTTRITHATPAAGYAHSANRDWEADSDIPDDYREGAQDIAWQCVHQKPGKDINVLLGGGRAKFLPATQTDPEYEDQNGSREDGRDLTQEWLDMRQRKKQSAKYTWNKAGLKDVSLADTDYLLGLFEMDHMRYNYDNANDKAGEPTLDEMVEAAVNILNKGDNGFFLLVEGGRIDHGHHEGIAGKALDETVGFNRAVEKVMELTSVKDTLITVTADHSHTLTMGGYPGRGNPILGMVDKFDIHSPLDGYQKTTLGYADGPGAIDGKRQNPAIALNDIFSYKQQAAIPTEIESHGGEDVPIYAIGPMAHLFTGVHEQNYIAHALAYAGCIGSNKEHCT